MGGGLFQGQIVEVGVSMSEYFLAFRIFAGNNFGAKIKISSSSDLCSSHDLNCRKCGEVLQLKYSEEKRTKYFQVKAVSVLGSF